MSFAQKEKIPNLSSNETIDLVVDTMKKQKQTMVFVNTKRGAEKLAEDIAKYILKNPALMTGREKWSGFAKQILNALEKPTKQCERLSFCVSAGIAFHHSGLAPKQREIIETAYRNREMTTICCTPTLAYGVDLPAYRVIIRDLKRYGHRGMDFIPVMEYLQQAGRAGRPKYDTRGEAIIIAQTESEAEMLTDKYVLGEAEEIYSKLAVEPVLRTYMLSLVSSGLINSRQSALDFFAKTFWAHQFSDMPRLAQILDKIIKQLAEWEFLYGVHPIQGNTPDTAHDSGFVSADELKTTGERNDLLRATPIGKRVSELYLDPYTAREMIVAFNRAKSEEMPLKIFPLLHMLSTALEMRPLLALRQKDYQRVEEFVFSSINTQLVLEPSRYDHDHDTYLQAAKTALFFYDWIDEKDEEYLLEEHNVRPGELRAKLDIADWLLYCCDELLRMQRLAAYRKDISKVRTLLKYGAREELLPLLQLRQIGRIRARKMFNHGVRDIADVKRADITTLAQLIGKETAVAVKKQVDQDPDEKIVKQGKRKGQISVGDYGK